MSDIIVSVDNSFPLVYHCNHCNGTNWVSCSGGLYTRTLIHWQRYDISHDVNSAGAVCPRMKLNTNIGATRSTNSTAAQLLIGQEKHFSLCLIKNNARLHASNRWLKNCTTTEAGGAFCSAPHNHLRSGTPSLGVFRALCPRILWHAFEKKCSGVVGQAVWHCSIWHMLRLSLKAGWHAFLQTKVLELSSSSG